MGATLTVELLLSGSWVDVTDYIFARAPVRITRGRLDGAIQSQPATMTFVANNTDGRWCATYALGAWYGQLRKGTWIRCRIDNGSGPIERFRGILAALPPRWDVSETDRYVAVTASGTSRRLGRGQVLRSAMTRAIPGTGPIAYWPCEDGPLATRIASAIGGQPMRTTGSVRFGAATGPDGSAPLVDTSSGAGLWSIVVPSTATSWRLEFVARARRLQSGEFATILQWLTSGGIAVWELVAGATVDGGAYLQYEASDGALSLLSGLGNVDDDEWRHYRVDASASGGSTVVTIKINNLLALSTTIALPFGSIGRVAVNPTASTDEGVAAVGHIAVWAPWASSVDTYTVYRGYAGEQAHTRFLRLCTEEGVAASSGSSSSQAMGPQSVATLPTLLDECAEADCGVHFDGISGDRVFQGQRERNNLPVALALDHSLGHVAPDFLPTDDDARIMNDFTANRRDGSWAQEVDSTSPMGTNTTTGVGRYDDSGTFNVDDDAQLPDLAGFRVRLGTVDGLRLPNVSLDFIRNPDLVDDWLFSDVGSRATLAHPPPGIPSDMFDEIVEGYTETAGPIDDVAGLLAWRADVNFAPYEPYRVGVVANTTGDTAEFLAHLDWSCVLAGSPSSTATSTTVTCTPLMTTAADDFPFDVLIGGERIRLTACSGASSPQTITMTRSINGVPKGHTAGDAVTIHPAYAAYLGL